jgi:hypothetical protein
VTWTVRDQANNSATTTQVVTVTPDHTPPQFVPDVLAAIDIPYGVPAPVLPPPTVTDNCGGPVVLTNNVPEHIELMSDQVAITWTATDQASNTSSVIQWVYVIGAPPYDDPGGPGGSGGSGGTGSQPQP